MGEEVAQHDSIRQLRTLPAAGKGDGRRGEIQRHGIPAGGDEGRQFPTAAAAGEQNASPGRMRGEMLEET